MTDKNLFSIGEVAKAVGITRKTILNYETKGLIFPDKKEGTFGNRYYTIDTFTRIRTIRAFQELGLSLDEIKGYFNDSSDLQPMIMRLEKLRDKLCLTIEKLKERVQKTNSTISQITIEPQTVYCRTYRSTSISDKTNLLRDTALEAMRKHGTDTTRRMYFTEHSVNAPEDISYCIAVPPESTGEHIKTLPTLRAISVFHHGAYENIPDSRNVLLLYAEQNNILLTGTFRNIYLEGPPQHKDKNKFLTQIIALMKD